MSPPLGVTPNVETKVLLIQIFGRKGHPVRKFQRMMYWFPKFKHTNPYPIPQHLPEDPVALARFSLTRIADDLDAKVTIYQVRHDMMCAGGCGGFVFCLFRCLPSHGSNLRPAGQIRSLLMFFFWPLKILNAFIASHLD